MIRVCVIGLGPIGNRHARLYKQDPLAELVGVCDILHDRADAAAEAYGVPAFYSVPEMLRALSPDVCSVATGGHEYGSDHYEPTMQALQAGCHVLGEKPISNEIDKAEEMVACAREMGVCYGIDLNHRFTPAARLAKSGRTRGGSGTCSLQHEYVDHEPARDVAVVPDRAPPHTVDVMRHFAETSRRCSALPRKRPDARSGRRRISPCASRTASSAG